MSALSDDVLPCQADAFDLGDEEVVYLNCAGRSPLSRRCQAVGEAAVRVKARPWTMGSSDAAASAVRERAARIYGAGSPECIAICPSTSFAFSALARSLGPRVSAGDVLVVLEDEMSSSVLAMQALAAARGAVLVVVPRPSDDDWASAILRGDGGFAWDRVAVRAGKGCEHPNFKPLLSRSFSTRFG